MKWEKTTLKKVTEYITDGDHQPAPKADKGISFIKIKDIDNNRISFSNSLFVPQEYYDKLPQNRKAVYGDVLYTVVGSYGIPVLVDFRKDFCFERNIALLHPNNTIEPPFLYYSMKNPVFFEQANNIANGSAQKLIPLSKLASMEISIPPLETQHRISSILSAYDDLIENNQKQIKLLEEAAQRLYKEWFVDLHFPGWENTKIVDGVPEGWEHKQICSIADIKAGGDKPEIVRKDKSKNTPFPIYANGIERDGLYGYTTKSVIEKESVTISARGTVGFVFLRRIPYVPIVRLLSVIPHTIPAIYLYYCLKNETFERNGTSQQQITVPMVKNKELLIADISVVDMFTSIS